jgi:GNAT superfamily N-acetyltransferase
MTDRIVEIAGEADRDRAIATLELAFSSDPVMRWFWPDPTVYKAFFGKFVTAMGGKAFSHGAAQWLEGGRAVALWLPPGVASDDDDVVEVMLQSVQAELLMDLSAFGDQVHEQHPAVDHWYLPITGVDPFFQGKGLGSTLLRHALAECDRVDLPAYLEASTPRSRVLYERLGFRVTEVIQVGTSPTVFAMLREPRSGSLEDPTGSAL